VSFAHPKFFIAIINLVWHQIMALNEDKMDKLLAAWVGDKGAANRCDKS
jgi:hypothetical protein